nr:mitochondrial carrier [Megavirus caiporensis]
MESIIIDIRKLSIQELEYLAGIIQHEKNISASIEYITSIVPDIFKNQISMIKFETNFNNDNINDLYHLTCNGSMEFIDGSILYSKCGMYTNGKFHRDENITLEYSNHNASQNFIINHNIFSENIKYIFSQNAFKILQSMNLKLNAFNKIMLLTLLYNFIIQTKYICSPDNKLTLLNHDIVKKYNCTKPSDRYIYLSSGNKIKYLFHK